MKVIDHPNLRLQKRIKELEKRIKETEMDCVILRDLLSRTIVIVQKIDADRFNVPLRGRKT